MVITDEAIFVLGRSRPWMSRSHQIILPVTLLVTLTWSASEE